MRNRKKPHRLILYTIRACQRIFENADFRCCKRERNEQNGDSAEQGNCKFGIFANGRAIVKLPSFVDIRNRSGDEENRDIDPIRRASNYAVVGVKENRDQNNTE